VTAQHHAHDHPPLDGAHDGEACLACPLCVALQALQGAKPEVLAHLVAAGRELTLALQALVESQAAVYERPEPRVERIRVD
jgi:hypothetical protein